MNVWATILLWEDSDPTKDRIVKQTDVERLTIVLAPDIDTAAAAASALVDEGVELIELCGGFGLEGGAAVAKAVDGRAAVGALAFGIESISQAAAYKSKFETAAG